MKSSLRCDILLEAFLSRRNNRRALNNNLSRLRNRAFRKEPPATTSSVSDRQEERRRFEITLGDWIPSEVEGEKRTRYK